MRTPLHLGLVLPPIPLGTRDPARQRAAAVGAVHEVASAAQRLGFTTLWFDDRPDGLGASALPPDDADPHTGSGVVDGTGGEVSTDGVTLAAGLAAAFPSLFLGVVAGSDGGRHPSVVARDVTSLDHVSGGRAALLLRYPGRVTEAATVCRGLLTGGAPTTFRGEHFTVEGAVNRPPPHQTGGVVLVAAVAGPDEVDRALADQVDGICAGGGPDELQAVAGRLAAVRSHDDGCEGDGPVLLWTGTLRESPATSADLDALRDVGVRGLMCRLPSSPSDPTAPLRAWAGALGAWRAP